MSNKLDKNQVRAFQLATQQLFEAAEDLYFSTHTDHGFDLTTAKEKFTQVDLTYLDARLNLKYISDGK